MEVSARQKVMEQYMKDVAEHAKMLKCDPYYAHSCGGGRVPEPCCQYCIEYDPGKGRCTKEWNNLDFTYYVDWRDDKEPDDLCEDYKWSGEWEE